MNKLFVAALKEETVGLNYFYHVGVGKINATYNLIKLIHKHKPLKIINYGTAGSLKKRVIRHCRMYKILSKRYGCTRLIRS